MRKRGGRGGTAAGREGGRGRWDERPWDGAERGAGDAGGDGRGGKLTRTRGVSPRGWWSGQRRAAGRAGRVQKGVRNACPRPHAASSLGACTRARRVAVCAGSGGARGRWRRPGGAEAATPLAHTRGGGVEQPGPTDRVRTLPARVGLGLDAAPGRSPAPLQRDTPFRGSPAARVSPPAPHPQHCVCQVSRPPRSLPAAPACPTSIRTTNARLGGAVNDCKELACPM